jgi:hypothetical protein
MPTYKNITPSMIVVSGVTFHPNRTVSTSVVINDERLVKSSDSPFYNPVLGSSVINGTSGQTISVTINLNSTLVVVIPTDVVSVYINDVQNTPAIKTKNKISIDSRSEISSIIVYFDNDASVEVHQFKQNGSFVEEVEG